ncbi:MAG: GGDEF domain-containing protein [Proteobacteria bacterium]|nr:GGDEF domain-containing protein [Pseudomonadota bacterium]MBU1709554.1 GGDEF domain-containing protein [Pseudomonadota bacterium]
MTIPDGKNDTAAGILVVKNDCDPRDLVRKISELTSRLADSTRIPPEQILPAPSHSLMHSLAIELDRIQQTRLPCSLLVIDLKNPDDQSAETIEKHLQETDIITSSSESAWTVIMPGTSLGRSVKRAEAIQQEFLALSPPVTIWIGMAIAYADDHMLPEEILAAAEKELVAAKRKKQSAICHVSGIRKEHSCQVTVEERAHLFELINGIGGS